MVRIIFLSFTLFVSTQILLSQELKYPLADKETNLSVPVSPNENSTWVKAHWEFVQSDYVWMPGVFIENLEYHAWRDGYWERNQKTGWWGYNPGYWQRVEGDMIFTGEDTYSKELSTEPIEQKSVFINMRGVASK